MVYLIFIASALPFVFLSIFLNKRSGGLLLFIYSCIYIFVFCASYRVGVDWYLYESFYKGISVKFYPEIGYQSISTIFSSIGLDYWLFAFLTKFTVFIVILRYCKKYCTLPLLVVFSFFIVTIQFHTDFLRQQIAFALMLMGVSSWSSFKQLFYFSLASTAHFSSILFSPVIVISKNKIIQTIIFYSTMCLFVFTLMNTTLLTEIIILLNPYLAGLIYFEKVKYYLFFGGGGDITIGHIIRNLILVFFYFIHVRQNKEKDALLDIFFSFVLLTVFYENLLFTSETLWTRLQCYGLLFFFLYPLRVFKDNIFYVKISSLIVLAYALYSSSGLLRESDFYRYYDDYGNLLSHLSRENYQEYKRSLLDEYWNYWQPRGAD